MNHDAILQLIEADISLNEVLMFARCAHQYQFREGSNIPYISHCLDVATLVLQYWETYKCSPTQSSLHELVSVALLHDVIEDTDRSFNDIEDISNQRVVTMVYWMTTFTTKDHGNRTIRKTLENERYYNAPSDVQFVKMCDIMANAKTVAQDKPDTVEMFVREKARLLGALQDSKDSSYMPTRQCWEILNNIRK